jgi:hypothetical protein
MSGWHELKAERNRQSLARLNKALPIIFPSAFRLERSAARSCRRRRGLRSNRIGAPIHSALIASRGPLRLAAERPAAGLGGSATVGGDCLARSGRRAPC